MVWVLLALGIIAVWLIGFWVTIYMGNRWFTDNWRISSDEELVSAFFLWWMALLIMGFQLFYRGMTRILSKISWPVKLADKHRKDDFDH